MTEPAESLNNFHDINNGYRVDMTAVNNLTQMLTYDMQGNILTLSRKGPIASQLYGVIDNITATYQGNQIATLRDDAANVLLETSLDMPHGSWSGSDFAYDRNGNQTRDLSRGVADIIYNELNLPARIEMDRGGSIEYLYTAAGTKLAEIVKDEDDNILNRRDYAGSFEYEADSVVRISLASGYVTVADTVYHLYAPDYQGNIVAVYNTTTGQQEHYKDYYPYGLPHAEMPQSSSILPGLNPGLGSGLGPIIITPTDPETSTPSTNRRWYGAKELTTDHGLNTYDFEARILAPAFPRFTTPDPLSERNNHISLYSFWSGDPVNRIDPTGLADFWHNGKLIGNDGIDDGRVFVIRATKIKHNDNESKEYTISKAEQKQTIKFIKEAKKEQSQETFKDNQWVYENCIEIEGSEETRQKMVDTIKDDGKRGTDDTNNREYGGKISDGEVIPVDPGEVVDPSEASSAGITIGSPNETTFHSHPSGTKRKDNTKYQYYQSPSPIDIENSGIKTRYVFAMRIKKVFIYNSQGIQTIIPLKRFVKPKK